MSLDSRTAVPVKLGWIVAPAGLLAVFATYWDEAWHTDVGRDTAWAAPHLLLYGSVGLVGIGVAVWGLRVLVALRSIRSTLTEVPLLAASLGALGALIASPIDATWHEAYGRDSVLFSPPHMLVVLASTALVFGVLAGLPTQARALRATAGVLLFANAVAVVFEYEADVPQFTEILYLPLLLLTGLAAAWVVARAVPLRFPVTTVVIGYAALRLVIAAGLTALGRSTPDLPIAVLGFAAFDLPFRHTAQRVTAAATATSTLALGASASGAASPVTADVAVAAVPLIAVGVLTLLALERRSRTAVLPLLFLAGTAISVLPVDRASAHDPGLGEPVASSRMTAETDAAGRVTVTVNLREHCNDLDPHSVTGRRAGQTITAPLDPAGQCTFRGALTLPEDGRWFVYSEFTHDGKAVEGWLPVEVGEPSRVQATRGLYLPAGEGAGTNATQIILGGLIYALGIGLVTVGLRATSSGRRLPARQARDATLGFRT